MPTEQKVATVDAYTELLKSAKSVYLADYIGLDVESISELRKQCRDESVTFTVVKNRLMIRAANAAGMEDLAQHLRGPVAVAVSTTDEVTPAKLITKFAKDHDMPKLKAAVVDGQVVGAAEAEAFAKLPSLPEVRSQLLSVLNGPAGAMVRLLAAPSSSLARVINARKDTL